MQPHGNPKVRRKDTRKAVTAPRERRDYHDLTARMFATLDAMQWAGPR